MEKIHELQDKTDKFENETSELAKILHNIIEEIIINNNEINKNLKHYQMLLEGIINRNIRNY